MSKFIFCLRSKHEMNEPRRRVGHEDKKKKESFQILILHFYKIGMIPQKLAITILKKNIIKTPIYQIN